MYDRERIAFVVFKEDVWQKWPWKHWTKKVLYEPVLKTRNYILFIAFEYIVEVR